MHALRANTLPETALVMSLVLMVLFGGVQMALTGFDQVSADGAAFVGAHSAVAQSPTNPSGTYANQVASGVFPHTAATGLTLSNPTGDTTELDYGSTFTTIGFSKFLGSGFATTSRIIEPSVGTSSALNGLPIPYQSTACIENKLNAATGTIAKAPIGLPVISSLTSVNSVTGVVSLTASGVSAQLTARYTLFSNLETTETSLTTDLAGVGSAINALLTSPLITGVTLSSLNAIIGPTSSTLSTLLSGAVQNALAGNTTAVATLATSVTALIASVNSLLAVLELLHPTLGTLVTNLNTELAKVVTDVTNLASYENTLAGIDSGASGVVCP